MQKIANTKPLGERPKWTRPKHTIERNEQAREKAKHLRKVIREKQAVGVR